MQSKNLNLKDSGCLFCFILSVNCSNCVKKMTADDPGQSGNLLFWLWKVNSAPPASAAAWWRGLHRNETCVCVCVCRWCWAQIYLDSDEERAAAWADIWQRCRCVSQRGRGRSTLCEESRVASWPLWIHVFGNKVLLWTYVCACVCVDGEDVGGGSLGCLSSYFCSTAVFLSTVTGMDVSEASMAGTFRGASTVRTPSGDREEVTFSTLTVEGSLRGGMGGWKKITGESEAAPNPVSQCVCVCARACGWVGRWPLDGSRVLQLGQRTLLLFRAWNSAVSSRPASTAWTQPRTSQVTEEAKLVCPDGIQFSTDTSFTVLTLSSLLFIRNVLV